MRADIIQPEGARQWFASHVQSDLLYELNQCMLIDDHDGKWYAWVPALDDNGDTVLREPSNALLEYASAEVLYWMACPRTPGQCHWNLVLCIK